MADIEASILLGREHRALEFKESQPWHELQYHVIRTAMAMANLRGGGTIVVGVSERRGSTSLAGMEPEHLSGYTFDRVHEQINRYANPHVSAELETIVIAGAPFLAITVRQFDDVPIICARDYEGHPRLRRGALYTRSKRKAETSELQDPNDLREILDLATDVRFAHFMRRLRLGDVSLQQMVEVSSRERFDEELQGL